MWRIYPDRSHALRFPPCPHASTHDTTAQTRWRHNSHGKRTVLLLQPGRTQQLELRKEANRTVSCKISFRHANYRSPVLQINSRVQNPLTQIRPQHHHRQHTISRATQNFESGSDVRLKNQPTKYNGRSEHDAARNARLGLTPASPAPPPEESPEHGDTHATAPAHSARTEPRLPPAQQRRRWGLAGGISRWGAGQIVAQFSRIVLHGKYPGRRSPFAFFLQVLYFYESRIALFRSRGTQGEIRFFEEDLASQARARAYADMRTRAEVANSMIHQ